jgi:type I restriction enzyme M protein
MTVRISQQQLESYLWGAAKLLRGTIDAGDYKQFIFPLLFYKRLCDVYDEETKAALAESEGDKEFASYPENHRFQIPPEAHWKEARKVAKNVGTALQNAFRAIETASPDKLYGIFGDAQWTNKDRLSDAMLRDLVEHFNSLELTLANLPEDELGNGYEYLIKKFADDAGHTAAEFYTNRTVVHLMTEMLQPQPGESIYDPTCGSGGMLISCIAQLRRQGKEWRNARIYGQERNLMTSSIARMNCFLHGIEDFRIERGDTLAEPKFVQGDRLQRFDIVLANPPYSIKQWDREAFASDPWGRNIFGTPPQGRADYAFWQHIIQSMNPKSGRCAILFPHGVLFRQEEAEMRQKIIEADLIECVLGLGPNLFYNSPMEACVVICRTAKPKARRGKILFVNAVNEVTRERAQSYLTDEHVQHIVKAYEQFKDEPGFARVASQDDIRAKDGNLSILLYVAPTEPGVKIESSNSMSLTGTLDSWLASRKTVAQSLCAVLPGFSSPTLDETLNGFESCALFDRSKWQRVRVGEVVENLNETCEPGEAGIERFVGLEHVEPGSLHIHEWGDVPNGTTFTRRCRPGQVLFGKRRAYQRKVAVAEFDAVVSGDIYVLAPKNDRLLPELLPFLCMSERFFQFAVETSAGSLSPRTNWSYLAKFEFDLPPLDQQRRIAEILWAVDDERQAWNDATVAASGVVESFIEQSLLEFEQTGRCVELGAVIDPDRPLCYGIVQPGDFAPNGNPFIRVCDIEGDSINVAALARVSEEVNRQYQRSIVCVGDVLVSVVGTIGRVAVVGPECNGFNIARAIARLAPSKDIRPQYLASFLRAPTVQRKLLDNTFETARKTLNLSALQKLTISLPPLPKQDVFLEKLQTIRAAEESLHQKASSTDDLTAAITNKFVGAMT